MKTIWRTESGRCIDCNMEDPDYLYSCITCGRCLCKHGPTCPSPTEYEQRRNDIVLEKAEEAEYVAWKVKHDEHNHMLRILAVVAALLISWFMWGYWKDRACIAEYEAVGTSHTMAVDLCSPPGE